MAVGLGGIESAKLIALISLDLARQSVLLVVSPETLNNAIIVLWIVGVLGMIKAAQNAITLIRYAQE